MARLLSGYTVGLKSSFQPTRPCRARLASGYTHPSLPRFNLRARAERDHPVLSSYIHIEFQSTRPYRARPKTVSTMTAVKCFNLRARAERDSIASAATSITFIVSIYAPVQGATGRITRISLLTVVSIYALVQGNTRSRSR